jgi:hypothetical protein
MYSKLLSPLPCHPTIGFSHYSESIQQHLEEEVANLNLPEQTLSRFGLKTKRMSWATGLVEDVEGIKYTEVMENMTLVIPEGRMLGLSITGGRDDNVEAGDNAIYINDIHEEGVAHADGRLLPGDKIM